MAAETQQPEPSTDPSVGFDLDVVVPGLLLGAAEALAVVWTSVHLFAFDAEQRGALLSASIPLAAFACAVWLGAMSAWIAPIWRAVRQKRRGVEIDAGVAKAASRALHRLPVRALLLHTAVWGVAGAAGGLLLASRGLLQPDQVATLSSVAGLCAFVANGVRALWYARLLARLERHLGLVAEPLRQFADRYAPRLWLVALLSGAAAIGALAAFLYFFLPLRGEEYLQMQTVLPCSVAMLSFVWAIYARRALRPIDAYLDEQLGGQRRRDDPRAVVAYRAAHTLPYRLAAAKVATWTVAAVGAAAIVRYRYRLDTDNTTLMLAAAVVLIVGTAIFEATWHRATMRPLLVHLSERHRLPLRKERSSLSLRAKLLISFGGLVLLACGLSLLWGFAQYKKLATGFMHAQAETKLDWIESEARGRLGQAAGRPTGESVWKVLEEAGIGASSDEAVFVYVPPDGTSRARIAGGGSEGAPRVPWYALARIGAGGRGIIEVGSLGLAGHYRALTLSQGGAQIPIGRVAVLYPSWRGRGLGIQRPLQELIVFFLVLFGACAGIVVITVAEFTTPIRQLEVRADEMARGELSQPVASGGEGDELGRLTFAIEEMRQALRDKLRSTEDLNLDLEREVERRTADLAKNNRELAETLEKLTRAQSQLVRSEKLASIGQLVSGIAHEINNPVNAIVNTVGPLDEAIDGLVALAPGAGAGAAAEAGAGVAAEAGAGAAANAGAAPSVAARDGGPGTAIDISSQVDEMRDMLKVIQRGATRTKAIVQALHNYARTDEEHVVEFDLDRGIEESLELLRHQLKNAITVERRYGDVGRIRGHAGQLNQVFLNLLTNAAQALAGREGARIEVQTERRDDEVTVRVTDNGPGIPPEILPRIWDPFFTTKDVGEGSGLGLSIVHGIVDRHGGTIEVDSEVGKGTTFTVVIPVETPGGTTG